VNELPQTSQSPLRGGVCVVLAASGPQAIFQRCLDSVNSHVPPGTTLVNIEAGTANLNEALEQLAPADVVVLTEACCVTDGWLERMREAALYDTNTATASALADVGTELALGHADRAAEGLVELAKALAADTLTLRPRLTRAVGPCVYVRREALELVGALDEELDLRSALEVDFAQRCLLAGLAHVAADNVLVERLAPLPSAALDELPARVLQRYPYLIDTPLAESRVLAHALHAARGPRSQLWVTLDARALDGAVTGTQVHILELILALARTRALRLRLLVWSERIDGETLELLRGLPSIELLAAEDVDSHTPRSTVFHRPQQAFSPGDVALAHTLGERVVLSQLDLIAYRNPGYFADAGSWADYRRASRHGLAAAERVVVFSEHTRRELLSDALVEPERVKVVAPGLDHRTSGEPRRPAALGEGGEEGSPLAAGFLLCLGTDFRHKNRLFALRLLGSLHADHAWGGTLVFAGTHIPYGSSMELERAFLEQHPDLSRSVLELGSVSEQEKAWLLLHAQAVVYPSVYEGFGLVPFESALNGVPCVFAPQSSLAEAAPAGTATILPWDPPASAAAAHVLLTDTEARKRHVETLAAAARALTWSAAAASMVEIYREASLAPARVAESLSRDAVERERTLTAAHAAVAATLIDEREGVLGDYYSLIEELGPGRGLIGSRGSLPEDLQRALLALSARPALSRPLYGALTWLFAGLRALARRVRAFPRRGHRR
jgi:glycosyltransferase involved in cell wall biosynthesis